MVFGLPVADKKNRFQEQPSFFDISLILQCFAAGCKEKMKKPLARFLGTGKWNKRKGYEFLNKRIGEPEGTQEGYGVRCFEQE